jgi:SNF2 family DNA or RNA helicase
LKARQLAKQGSKTIIWSTFVENVELIANRLADLGADFIHGGVEAGSEEDENTREKKIARFHEDPRAMVLVANPAACAESISLHTVCHNALYVDRNYNAAQYLQSEDRIHRLGLPSGTITNVEILVCPDTVDESVRFRLESKVQRMARTLNDDSLNIEPVETDLDEDGLDEEDLQDYLKHIMGKNQ